MQEKQNQYSQLNNLLQMEGFQGMLNPIILGISGGMIKIQDNLLTKLGYGQQQIRKLNMKLHAHVIQSMRRLMEQRSLKEAELQHRHVHRKLEKQPLDK